MKSLFLPRCRIFFDGGLGYKQRVSSRSASWIDNRRRRRGTTNHIVARMRCHECKVNALHGGGENHEGSCFQRIGPCESFANGSDSVTLTIGITNISWNYDGELIIDRLPIFFGGCIRGVVLNLHNLTSCGCAVIAKAKANAILNDFLLCCYAQAETKASEQGKSFKQRG